MFDSSGNMYISEQGSALSGYSIIRKVDATTKFISTVAGTGVAGYTGDGGPPLSATFIRAYGLAIDCFDNLYVRVTSAPQQRLINSVRVIDFTESVLTLVLVDKLVLMPVMG